MNKNNTVSRKIHKNLKKQKQREVRVVEYIDYSGLILDCPIQLMEGYILTDTASHEAFISFICKNISKQEIKVFKIRIHLYQNSNIPYEKIDFDFSYKDNTLGERIVVNDSKKNNFKSVQNNEHIQPFEQFGKFIYIKLPPSYFKRLKVEVVGVVYADGQYSDISVIADNFGSEINKLDDEKRYVYSKINKYNEKETQYPSKTIPQISKDIWVCCCGNKNMLEKTICDICDRERDWQLEVINDTALQIKSNELKENRDKYYMDKTRYSQMKYLETKEEKVKKIEQYQKAIRKITEREKRTDKLKTYIIPITIVAVIIFISIIGYILSFLL
ncbi:hypothetical protein LJB90_01915 [Eubacteriales bacterium OttesenSCG-928-G02]|nr:hypothetical protein [Eubacteriales bacterium OttesenSCG-928-G02]